MARRQLVEFKTFLTYSDITGHTISLRTLKSDLRQLRFPPILVILAKINTLVALTRISGDKFPAPAVNDFLIENFVSPELRQHPRAVAAQKQNHPFFVRHPLLSLLRMSALECSQAGPLLPDGRTEGGHLVGKCCLVAPDHLVPRRIQRAMAEGTDNRRRRVFGMFTSPTFEFNFPPDLRYVMVRWDTMLTELLDSPQYRAKIGDFDLAGRFFDATGLKLDLYRDLIFSTLAHYYSLKLENSGDKDFLLFHRTGYIKQTELDQRDFDHFLDICAIRLEDVPSEIRRAAEEFPGSLPQFDFAVFRQRPILELGNGGLLCLDPFFLIDKLGDGLRHTIRDSLPSAEDKRKVSKAYGLLFELYVDSIMRQIYPRGEEYFISFPQFARVKGGANEAFDGILVCRDGHIIVFEYKGGFLKAAPKYGGRIRAFIRDLDMKFGAGERGAGVLQMVRKIQRLYHRQKGERDQIAELEQHRVQVRKITPVLIVQEPALRWDFNWFLNRLFKRLLRRARVTKAVEVMPLQVIDIESLEKMRPNLIAGDFRLEQCLNARALRDPQLISVFSLFVREFFENYGQREDPEIDGRFDAIRRRNLRTLFSRELAAAEEASPGR